MQQQAFTPQIGDYYWVALSRENIFGVYYWDDAMDRAWLYHGKAYPTKQDAREAMGFGIPISE